MTRQYSDWQVSNAQGALPAQIAVEQWFTADAFPGRFLQPARYNLLELLGLGALGALGISKAHIV